jgi:acetyl esterase/lipase
MTTAKECLQISHTLLSRSACFFILVLCILTAGCTKAEEPAPTSIPTATALPPTNTPFLPTPTTAPAVEAFTDNIPYRNKFDVYQLLSVRLPENKTPPFPTIMVFHPGGFGMGDRSDMDEFALALSERGVAVVNVNYTFDQYPAPVEDAFCALAWVHNEAPKYGFNTNRVVALGIDAGGNLAALLGVVTNPSPYLKDCPNFDLPEHAVAGVVSYCAYYDFGAQDDFVGWLQDVKVYYLDATQEGFDQRVIQASPVSHLHADAPPFLLIHGLADDYLTIEHTESFVTALQEEGVPVEFIEVAGIMMNTK